MSVTKTLSNNLKFQLGSGAIDFTGAFRVILMADTFTFDRTTHDIYGDISASELATSNGYTQGSAELIVDSAWAQDDVNNKASVSWADYTWTASGGSIGPTISAIVLQWDSGTTANSIVVGEIHFGTAKTITDGVSFQLQDLGFDLSQGSS